jgi:hypothetical protein
MGRKKSKENEDFRDNDKRQKDLKIIYDEGKRILNNLVNNFKKWFNYFGLVLILFFVISFLLFFYFGENKHRYFYLFLAITSFVSSLFFIYVGNFKPWYTLESHKDLIKVPKMNVKEWYEFINNVEFEKNNKEKYGLAEIILRIYYNIDIWLKIEYQINLKKYQLLIVVFFFVNCMILPLDNSYSLFKIIGLVSVGMGTAISFILLFFIFSQKKMNEKVSKWHKKTNDLDNKLWNLWRGYR